jgi:histidine triad (HIT) family protein
MNSCLFCRIVQKEIPAQICAESENALAFHDIAPQAPVHVLVIPKRHIESVTDIGPNDSALTGELILLAHKAAELTGAKTNGFRLVVNYGPDAGQAVKHLHMHVLGKRKLSWPPG